MQSSLVHRVLAFRDSHDASYFFQNLKKLVGSYAGLVGLNMFREGYTNKNPVFIWSVSWIVAFIFTNLYTVYLRTSSSFLATLICTTTLGMPFQGLGKMYLFGAFHDALREKIDFGLTFYQTFKRPQIKLIARDFAFGCWVLYFFVLQAAYIIAITIGLSVPVIYTWFKDSKIILPIDIQLPFVGVDGVGFAVHLLYLFVSAVMEFIGTWCGDTFYSMLLLNAFTQIENLFVEIDALNEMIEGEEKEEAGAVSLQLKNIIGLHQIYIDYISFIVDNFELYFTTNVVTLVFQVSLALYAVFTDVSSP